MLSNTCTHKNVYINKKQSRSTSKLDCLGKSKSVERSEKNKPVKEKLDCSMFMTIIVMFENSLSQLNINNVNEEVLDKLIKTEEVLKEKIFLTIKNNNHKNVGFSKGLTSSMGNLNSEAHEENVRLDSSFEDFFKRMNCPFCLEPKADKIKLIQHLERDCKPRINKKFDEKYNLEYSVFQILPNNTFKCNICSINFINNLENYLKHLQNDFHISVYAKTSKVKNYTDFLFCSCCKVQVANNYTQIHFHMNHQVHKTKAESASKPKNGMKSGIIYVYLKSKKFKCFECPGIFFKTTGDIIKHFKDRKHFKYGRKNAHLYDKFFCEVCSEKVPMFEIFDHFLLRSHKDKENEAVEENYEMCFFCGFLCGNLMDLSLHMESKCSEIKKIKQQNPEFKKTTENYLKDKTADESNIEGGHIIIKDYKDMPTLFSYFEQFGEITSVESYDDKHVMLKFREKSAATCVLLLRNRFCINGVELEITTEDKLFKSKAKMVVSDEEKQILSESENSLSSCDSSESEENGDSNEDRVSNCDEMLQKDELQILFQKVTSHLVNISQRSKSNTDIRTILDCLETCNLVGFAGCELSFPVESISLYYPMEADLLTSTRNISENDADLKSLIFLRKLKKKMSESDLWQDIIISVKSFPYINCIHKETQKACTIICSSSAMLLTEMLSDCLKDSYLVRSFCFLIRFWLAVHKLEIRKFEYVVMSLLIFFLTSKKVVNLSRDIYYTKDDFSLEKKIQDELGLNEKSSKESKEAYNLQKLFHEFLLFLYTFEFDKLAIYLPLFYPLPKTFILKKVKLATKTSPDKISKSSMFITESRSLQNLAIYISERHVKSLLNVVNSSIKNILK